MQFDGTKINDCCRSANPEKTGRCTLSSLLQNLNECVAEATGKGIKCVQTQINANALFDRACNMTVMKAKVEVDKNQAEFIKSSESRLVQSTKALTMIAGGLDHGKNWDEALADAEHCTWEQLQDCVKKNLLSNDTMADALMAARKQCLED